MPEIPAIRKCRRCGQDKILSLDNFLMNAGRYFRRTCKLCDHIYNNEWRANHRGKPKTVKPVDTPNSTERMCTKCGKTKILSIDNFRQQRSNRGVLYFRRKCRECCSIAHNEYLRKHRKLPAVAAKRREEQRRRRAKDPTWRELSNKYQKLRYARTKCEVLQYYGGKCKCCGEEDWRFLTLDHVDDDGANHRRVINSKRKSGGRVPSGESLYRWLKFHKYPPDINIRVLCYNCNCGRSINGGVCPHVDGYPRRLSTVRSVLALAKLPKRESSALEGTSIMFAGE